MYLNRTFLLSFIVLFISGCKSGEAGHQIGSFEARSDAFWEVVSRDALAERIGIRFEFTEGPVCLPGGELLFSDIPKNTIYHFKGKSFKEFRKPSNHSNGLLALRDGSILACEHGSRSLTKNSPDGTSVTLADNYKGKRLNSPNDLCRSHQGLIFFTDPPWGLSGLNDDPGKELSFNGVFMLRDGKLSVIDSTLSWPNGIALSPDDRYLYVANFEGERGGEQSEWEVFWMRYELGPEGRVLNRSRFFQATDLSLPGGPDGMKVDKRGNLFATGPGGILVISPDGEHLGTIGLPIPASNLAFTPGGKTIYVTARTSIVRIRLR